MSIIKSRLIGYLRKFSSLAPKYNIDPIQEASLRENCILVNENDEAIGHASKFDCHKIPDDGNLPLHRAFSVFLFNSDNELLLHKRSDRKITFPGQWTNTCCSHPLFDFEIERNEDKAIGVKHAARRRLQHELGINVSNIELDGLKYLTRFIYKSLGDGIWGEYELDYILFLKTDLELNPNENEISEIRYVPLGKFNEFVETTSEPFTPWFELISKKHLTKWWSEIDNLKKFQDHITIHKYI